MGNQEVYAPAGLTLGTGSQVLAYCCSRGLLLASVVGQAHCCSVVIVQHFNTVGQTLKSSSRKLGLGISPARIILWAGSRSSALAALGMGRPVRRRSVATEFGIFHLRAVPLAFPRSRVYVRPVNLILECTCLLCNIAITADR